MPKSEHGTQSPFMTGVAAPTAADALATRLLLALLGEDERDWAENLLKETHPGVKYLASAWAVAGLRGSEWRRMENSGGYLQAQTSEKPIREEILDWLNHHGVNPGENLAEPSELALVSLLVSSAEWIQHYTDLGQHARHYQADGAGWLLSSPTDRTEIIDTESCGEVAVHLKRSWEDLDAVSIIAHATASREDVYRAGEEIVQKLLLEKPGHTNSKHPKPRNAADSGLVARNPLGQRPDLAAILPSFTKTDFARTVLDWPVSQKLARTQQPGILYQYTPVSYTLDGLNANGTERFSQNGAVGETALLPGRAVVYNRPYLLLTLPRSGAWEGTVTSTTWVYLG